MPSPRLAGRLRRARIRVAHGAITLGGALHGALAEFGLWLEPKFGTDADGYGAPRPWAGLAVLVILLCGVALVAGGTGLAIVDAIPPPGGAPMTASSGAHSVTPSAAPPVADDALHRLWMDFVEASTRAQRTLVYADGMAAREAWGRFMTAYEPPRQGGLPGQHIA